jgi:aminopeptidase N
MYLFGDIGIMTYDDKNGIERTLLPRGDAGLGTTFTIKKFGALQNVKPLVIRFDMPFYVSHPSGVENNFQFRWMFGINRAF